jgi:hypothetical protein
MPIVLLSWWRPVSFAAVYLFLLSVPAKSQTVFQIHAQVNGTALSQLPGSYVSLQRANNGNEVYTERAGIVVSNGQTSGLAMDDRSQKVAFDNMLLVFNFMAFNGWEYVGIADKDLFTGFVVKTTVYLFRRK